MQVSRRTEHLGLGNDTSAGADWNVILFGWLEGFMVGKKLQQHSTELSCYK